MCEKKIRRYDDGRRVRLTIGAIINVSLLLLKKLIFLLPSVPRYTGLLINYVPTDNAFVN